MASSYESAIEVAKSNDGEAKTEEMRDALTTITHEIKKYYSTTTLSTFSSNLYELKQDDDILANKEIYKFRLRSKKSQIKKLKENLKTACLIAKTVIAAKENETQSLNKHLNSARCESVNLMKKNTESVEIIQKLTVENQILSEKLQNFYNFIDLGYKELQKMRNESLNEIAAAMKLKQIMISCGQYYADYYNEREKCLQLEQRNRFLNNKINILETSLNSTSRELKTLKFQRALKDKSAISDKKTKNDTSPRKGCSKDNSIRSDRKFDQSKQIARMAIENVDPTRKGEGSITMITANLDLASHLSLVKNLLNDQNLMLEDLRNLSKELDILNS